MFINKKIIALILTTFALCITNFNANENSKTYLKYSPSEVALSYAGNSVIRIGDTPSSIGLLLFKMKRRTNGIKWTNEEKSYLVNNYANTDNTILAEKLNKTVSSILGISKSLRIFKSDEYISKLRFDSNNITNNNTLNERFNSFLKNSKILHNGNFDYSKFKYINVIIKGIIICPIHGEFECSPRKHIGKELIGCPICYKEYNDTKSERFNHFLERANKMHNNKFDYSKFVYVDAKTYGTIICPVHGDFEQMPDKHLAPNSKGCQKCWFDMMSYVLKNTPKHITKEHICKDEFLKKCLELYGNKYSYDLTNYNGVTKNEIKITCPIHGEFYAKPNSHLGTSIKSTGCPLCSNDKRKESKTKSYDKLISQVTDIHNEKYIYPNENRFTYINKESIIGIICPLHGEFKKRADKHVVGQGCFRCKMDELIMKNILIGIYSEELFLRKPELKNKPALLYYLKINDGELYKIGISTKIDGRIKSLKSKSKNKIEIEIIKTKEYTMYDAFILEQKILSDFKEFRVITYWSSELFNKDIFKKIKKHFKNN